MLKELRNQLEEPTSQIQDNFRFNKDIWMDKMGIEMPLLAEGIKQKPDQVSGSSCQFVGNTEEQRVKVRNPDYEKLQIKCFKSLNR